MKAAEAQCSDYRFLLTSLSSLYNLLGMARFKDIVSGLAKYTSVKSEELSRDLDEMNKLRAAWQRYQELSRQVESKERTVRIGYALLLSAPEKVNVNADAYDAMCDQLEALDLSTVSLWRVIREIVCQTGEIRVYELEAHLKGFGLKKATRPAIESALVTHPKEFTVRKNGREKFVSVK